MLENFKDFLWFLISLFNIALWAKQQKLRKCLFAPQYVLKVFQFHSSQTDYLLHSCWCQFLNKLLSGFQMVYYSLNLVIWEKLPWGVNDLCQVCSQQKLRKTSKNIIANCSWPESLHLLMHLSALCSSTLLLPQCMRACSQAVFFLTEFA